MSARIEMESLSRRDLGTFDPVPASSFSEAQMESLFRNVAEQDLVAPLREAHAARASGKPCLQTDAKCQEGLALQEEWQARLEHRESLRADIKRGREYLQQIRRELDALKDRLEEWPTFERTCGKNPLLEYAQRISAKERISKYLPVWLKRREQQLKAVNQQIGSFARKNGLKHRL
jgi:hypothetical protein